MELITKGNTAEIYAYENNLICKLFFSGYATEFVNHEFHNASLVYKLGVKTPKAYKTVSIEGRDGIVYDYIIGEELSHKVFNATETSFDMWMKNFADFHKELLKHNADDAMNYKDFLKMFAAGEATIDKIDALADGNCLIHGDYHLSNVMVDEDNNLVLIDMMNICRGPALYDVARTYFLLNYDKRIQKKYLELMGYSLEDITPYLEVITAIRDKELGK